MILLLSHFPEKKTEAPSPCDVTSQAFSPAVLRKHFHAYPGCWNIPQTLPLTCFVPGSRWRLSPDPCPQACSIPGQGRGCVQSQCRSQRPRLTARWRGQSRLRSPPDLMANRIWTLNPHTTLYTEVSTFVSCLKVQLSYPRGNALGSVVSQELCVILCSVPCHPWGLRASWPLLTSAMLEKNHTLFRAIPFLPLASGPTAPLSPWHSRTPRMGTQWLLPSTARPPLWVHLQGGLRSVAEGRSGQGYGFELWRFGGIFPALPQGASFLPFQASLRV